MTFNIITFGCKVNTYESDYLKEKMISNDFKEVVDDADITIVNTCSYGGRGRSRCARLDSNNCAAMGTVRTVGCI